MTAHANLLIGVVLGHWMLPVIACAQDEAILAAERSVVAIAVVPQATPAEALAADYRPDPFGRPVAPPALPGPTDPDYVPTAYATGVVVDRGGLVLTAYHLLPEGAQLYVTTPRRKVYRAEIKAADPRSDLAVLAIDAGDLTPIALGDAAALRKGQAVATLGNPYTIARHGRAEVRRGTIAALGRKACAGDAETIHQHGTLIETDVRPGPGGSGGPLVGLRGEMIGLVCGTAAGTGGRRPAARAYPVDAAFRRALDALELGGEVEYGFLGLKPKPLAAEEVAAGLAGVRVERVVSGTPAARAGLQANDLLTALDGAAIRDPDAFMLSVSRLDLDAVVRLTVLRAGKTRDIDVGLTKFPVRGKKIVTAPAPAWRGLRIDYPSAAVEPGGLPFPVAYREGVAVTEVAKGSPAWAAGLRPGMTILEVRRQAVQTPRQFRALVGKRPDPVELRFAGENGEILVKTVGGGP